MQTTAEADPDEEIVSQGFSIPNLDKGLSATSNPWCDIPAGRDHDPRETELKASDSRLLDAFVTTDKLESLDLSSDDPEGALTDLPDVLSKFDPFAIQEEEAARDAWTTSEAHPPSFSAPLQTIPSPSHSITDHVDNSFNAPSPSLPDLPSASTFPSFASLARNFSLPLLSRPRPLSLDGSSAKQVTSPLTLSSLSAHHDISRDHSYPDSHTSPFTASDSRQYGEIPFDFQRFLDQMKNRSAEPVSKYLRSFLSNYAKRTFTVNDQVKIINDFLSFIAGQMRHCEVWKNATDVEFDNAMEGMEKLVMNRLYDFTFTPQIVHSIPPRPITTDDLERDRVLSQRLALFGWVEEEHLDVPQGEGSAGFLMFAQQELLKINHYKAPRDKLICILNCCKVIYGLIRHLRKDEGADSFLPVLIFVVLKASPDHLLSNVEFINRFRNPEKLRSEAGYYLSSLIGAVSFIETMDHTSLSNITQDEFEKNVENAIQALPVSNPSSPQAPGSGMEIRVFPLPKSSLAGEESAQPLSLPTPVHTLSDDAKKLLQKTGDTISKPLSAIGRILTEALDEAEEKLAQFPGTFSHFPRDHHRGSSDPTLSQKSALDWPNSGLDASVSSIHPYPETPFTLDRKLQTPPIQTSYKPRVRRIPSPSSISTPTGVPAFGSGTPGFSPEDLPSSINPPYLNQLHSSSQSSGITAAYKPRFQQQQHPPSLPPRDHPPPLPPRVQSLAASNSLAAESISRTPTPRLDLAAIEAQIDAAHDHAALAARETLVQIFPAVDMEVIQCVYEWNEGDLGKSIEALLEMSSGS